MSAAVSLDEPEVAAAATRIRRIENLYVHARVALAFARTYMREGDAFRSRRVQDAVSSAQYYRHTITLLRRGVDL